MDKETLSNYGWVVICVLVLVVMIALATPFGSFISQAVQSTTKGLFDVNKSALDNTGLITIDDQEFDVPDMNHGAGEDAGNQGQTPVVPEETEEIEFVLVRGLGPDKETFKYKFEKGMTWREFIDSEYNTYNFSIHTSSNKAQIDLDTITLDGNPVYADDVIIEEGNYKAALSIA